MSDEKTNLEPTIKQFFKEIKAYVKEKHFNGQVLVKLEFIDGFVQLSIVDVTDNKHQGGYHRWLLDDGDDFVNLDELKVAISSHIIDGQKQLLEERSSKDKLT